jgi:hypothetical protein
MAMKGALALWLKKNGNKLGRAVKDAIPSADEALSATAKGAGTVIGKVGSNPKKASALAGAAAGAGAVEALDDDDDDKPKKKKKASDYLDSKEC